ncbi:MAG: hypothetical protein WBQ86_00840 [Candidatus Binatus sp.]
MASDALLDHSGLSAEAALVLCCATTAVTPSRTAIASELAARVRSWARVAEIAKCHGVLPLIHRYLNSNARRPFRTRPSRCCGREGR